MRYTVAHLLGYALTTKSGKDRAKFMARVLNTADTISLSAPAELSGHQLILIFSYDAGHKYRFEEWVEKNTVPQITFENIISCFDCANIDQRSAKEQLHRDWENGDLKEFSEHLKQFATQNGVTIAGCVYFVP